MLLNYPIKFFCVMLISEVSQSNTAVNGAIRWWLWMNSVTVEHVSFFSSKGIIYIILILSWLSLKNQSYTLPPLLCVIVSIDGASRKNWKRPVPSLNRSVSREVPIMQSSYSQLIFGMFYHRKISIYYRQGLLFIYLKSVPNGTVSHQS